MPKERGGPWLCSCGQVFPHKRFLAEHLAAYDPYWFLDLTKGEHRPVEQFNERKPKAGNRRYE